MPRDVDHVGGGVTAWGRRWWRALLAETVATALLLVLGVGSLMPVGNAKTPLTNPALAFAFVVTANIQAFGAVSGAHMNPAVTLAALLYGQLPAAAAAAYAGAQLLGAVLGFAALQALVPVSEASFGCTGPSNNTSPWAAMWVEALLTGTLALVACGVWAAHDPTRPDHSAPIKFGLTVGGLVYAGGEMTGASLNPARSLAPALLVGKWEYHWVYWAGPLGGAAAAALLHRWVLLPRTPPARPSARDELPLRDKQLQDC